MQLLRESTEREDSASPLQQLHEMQQSRLTSSFSLHPHLDPLLHGERHAVSIGGKSVFNLKVVQVSMCCGLAAKFLKGYCHWSFLLVRSGPLNRLFYSLEQQKEILIVIQSKNHCF